MKKSKNIHQPLETDDAKIDRVVADMQVPELPDINMEWDALEKRIDIAEAKKIVSGRSGMSLFGLVAAGVVLLIAGWLGYLNFKSEQITTTTNKLTITLKDGSEVYINRNSSIRYNAGYGLLNRNITLTGEAFFKVKKGRENFRVITNEAQIRVTGTQFNVKSRRANTEVGVSEGRVEFASKIKPASKVILTKGLYSICERNKIPTEGVNIVIADFPGWIHNRLIYNNTKLGEVISDIEDQFGITIKVNNIEMLKLEVNGILEGNSPEEILDILCTLTGKIYRKTNENYEVY